MSVQTTLFLFGPDILPGSLSNDTLRLALC